MFWSTSAASHGGGNCAGVPAKDVIGGERGTRASDPATEQTRLRVAQMKSERPDDRRFNGFDLTPHLRKRGVVLRRKIQPETVDRLRDRVAGLGVLIGGLGT